MVSLGGSGPLFAAAVGAAASSALVVGSVLGAYWDAPEDLVAAALAFASGALITALAFDLFQSAFDLAGAWVAGTGLLAGAAVFVGADLLLQRRSDGDETGLALLAGVTLDGVPENLALGVVLVGGASEGLLPLLAAIFASNLPESLGGAQEMHGGDDGLSKAATVGAWTGVGVLLAAAVVVGYVAFGGLSDEALAVARAFAGGAVLASVADTAMPDAYEEGGPLVAFATAAGFLLTFLLN